MNTKINIRKIELKDYEFINKWWVKQGFKIPNKDVERCILGNRKVRTSRI